MKRKQAFSFSIKLLNYQNMNYTDWIPAYIVIGLMYTLINGLVRKIYSDDDMLLAFAHIVLWWLFLIGAIAYFIKTQIKKYKVNGLEKHSKNSS